MSIELVMPSKYLNLRHPLLLPQEEEKRATEGEMVGWHLWLNGHEFEQTWEDSEGQGRLACCSPWGHKESDVTEQLINNDIK